jgi:hypothetical protein
VGGCIESLWCHQDDLVLAQIARQLPQRNRLLWGGTTAMGWDKNDWADALLLVLLHCLPGHL